MVKNLFIIALAFALIGCGSDPSLPSSFTVDGKAEKGILQFGSPVTFHGLDSTFTVQTGNNATAYITDHLGNYSSSVSLDPGTSYGAVNAYGFYFNENSGVMSSQRINLWSYLLPDTGPNNVNVATFVIMPRVKALDDVSQATVNQASQELVFQFLGFAYTDGANKWTTSDSSPLLALSAIIQHGRTEQGIENFIGDLGNDLADGVLTPANKDILAASAQAINIAQIVTNTNGYLSTHGGGTAQDFTGWLTNLDPSRLVAGVHNQGTGTASSSTNIGVGGYHLIVPFTITATTTIQYASYQCDSGVVDIYSVDPKLGGTPIHSGVSSNSALPSRDYNGQTPSTFQSVFSAFTLAPGNYWADVTTSAPCATTQTFEAVEHDVMTYSTDMINFFNLDTGANTIKLQFYGG